jgi:hypothetical protein
MNHLLYLCIGTRKNPMERTLSVDSLSDKPPVKICYDCSNYLCANNTQNISEWRLVKRKTRKFYFCKEECWEEWLKELL